MSKPVILGFKVMVKVLTHPRSVNFAGIWRMLGVVDADDDALPVLMKLNAKKGSAMTGKLVIGDVIVPVEGKICVFGLETVLVFHAKGGLHMPDFDTAGWMKFTYSNTLEGAFLNARGAFVATRKP